MADFNKNTIAVIAAILVSALIIGGAIIISGNNNNSGSGSSSSSSTNSGSSTSSESSSTSDTENASIKIFTLPNDVKLEMVKIKAGTFMMGSPSSELGRYNENQHRVTLTRDYWLGKFEVTQAQYEAIMGNNPSYFKGSNRPVEQVSWNDAKAFCNKLNERYAGKLPAGYMFDLPTEAQWEYACRAGTTTAFSYGNSSDDTKMNFGGNRPYGGSAKGKYRGETVEVGSLGYKNAFGLYDMHGNVWEWCRDWYGNYTGATTDPVGPSSGWHRVFRGGSWINVAWSCRSAYRIDYSPGNRTNVLGFRLALVPAEGGGIAASEVVAALPQL